MPKGIHSGTAWSDERIEQLKALYAEGRWTFAQIAAKLGVSRNSAIGKCHRLNLYQPQIKIAKNDGPTRRSIGVGAAVQKINAAKAERKSPFRPGPKVKPEPFVCAPVVNLEPLHLTLADLKEGDCRFPFGDVPAAMTFCGHRAVSGRSWCAKHLAVVTAPTPPRRQSAAFIARGAAA